MPPYYLLRCLHKSQWAGRYLFGNPSPGWAVTHGNTVLSSVLSSLRKAQRWAEGKYPVKGWRKLGGWPWHHHEAVW